jgi:hypothetical protein
MGVEALLVELPVLLQQVVMSIVFSEVAIEVQSGLFSTTISEYWRG